MKKKFALVIAIVMVLSIFTAVMVACNNLTITFDSNGGSEIEQAKETVKNEPKPTKEGHTFVGWYETKDFSSEKVVFPYTTTKNVTLYAKWEVKGPEVEDVVADLLKLLSNEMKYDSAKQNITWDFELDAFSTTGDTTTTYRLSSKANIVTENVNDAAISFAIQEVAGEEVKNIVSIVVDNGYIYLDTIDGDGNAFQRKFNGFELGEILKVKHIGDPSAPVDMALGLVFGLLFQEARIDGDIATLTGNIDEVLDALPTLLGAFIQDVDIAGILDATGIVGMLTGTQFQLVANIKEFNGIKITAVKTDNFDAGISLNRAKFDSTETALAIDVPAEIKNLDAINLLNFTLEGRFSLVSKDIYFRETRTTFTYELRTDLDPFSMMEVQADGSVKFNAMNILDSGMIWFDVFHDCDTHGNKGYEASAFCSSRAAGKNADGSIITLAFDPANFGNNNINLSLNPNFIFNKTFYSDALGIDLTNMLGDYVGLTINPEALLEMIMPSEAAPNAVADIDTASIIGTLFDILVNLDYSKNYIGLIGDVLNVLSGITLDNNGVNIDNLGSVFSILDNFVAFELNGNKLSTILVKLFTADVNEVELSVDNLAFADLENVGFGAGAKYAYTNDYDGQLKNYVGGTGTSRIDYTPAVDYEWITEKGIDGKDRAVLSAPGVITKDGDKVLPISATEAEALLSKGNVAYKAIYPNGSVENATTGIIRVLEGPARDTDGKILHGEHNVKLLTQMTDGGALSNLLALAGGFIGGNLTIPGNVIETTIFVTETVGEIKFSQDEQYADINFDENKTYSYNDHLNPFFNVEVEYDYKMGESTTNYKKTIERLTPTVLEYGTGVGSIFYNYNNPANAQIQAAGNLTLVYSAFGTEKVLNVKMNEGWLTRINDNTDAMVYEGKDLETVKPIQLPAGGTFTIPTDRYNTIVYNNGTADVTLNNVWARGVAFNESDNYTIDGRTVTFVNEGTYSVTGTFLGATFEIMFQIGDQSIPAPKYSMAVSPVTDGYIPVSVTHPIQGGNGIDVKFEVSIDGVDVATDKFTVYEKVNGEYVVAKDIFFNKYIAPWNPQQYFIQLAEDVSITKYSEIKVTAVATDPIYGGSEAASGEFSYGFAVNFGKFETDFMGAGALGLQLLANSSIDNVQIELKVGEEVKPIKYYSLMDLGGGMMMFVELSNYSPSFRPAAESSTVYFAFEGMTADSSFTITVKDAAGVVLTTATK